MGKVKKKMAPTTVIIRPPFLFRGKQKKKKSEVWAKERLGLS